MLTLTQAKAKKVEENPFFGLSHLLNMFQQLPKVKDPTSGYQVDQYLDAAWEELQEITDKTRKEQAIEVFYSILFSIGDIANRQHNIFGKSQVDNGGNSSRKTFRFCLDWVLRQDNDMFYEFLDLISEFTSNENLLFYQITTDRWKGKVTSIEKLNVDTQKIAKYFASRIRDRKIQPVELTLLAKFMPKVPTSARYTKNEAGVSVRREKQAATKTKDIAALVFIEAISNEMEWEIVQYPKNVKFKGYETFRKMHLAMTEAHLFSTGEITKMDKTQFWSWLDTLPNSARYRVQTRILNKEKGTNKLSAKDKWVNTFGESLGTLFLGWLDNKSTALARLKALTSEQKSNMTVKEVKQLEKTAKLNVGATNLLEVVVEFLGARGNQDEMDLKAEAILKMIKIAVPVLVIGDRSGSMNGNRVTVTINGKHYMVTPREVMVLAVTVFLMKNPDHELRDTFMLFSDMATIIQGGKVEVAGNKASRFSTPETIEVDTPLIDDTQTFTQNYLRIKSIIDAQSKPTGTHLTCIATELKRWVDADPNTKSQKIEMIQKYQVWLVVSDGDVNNSTGPGASLEEMKMKMRQWFGAEPVFVIWDVKAESPYDRNKFENIDNVMYFGSLNYGVLNQILCNIDEFDIIDIYTALNALYQSNRYELVRNAVKRNLLAR